MKVLFLGSGGSMGIPVIGCKCSVCLSPSYYNKRLRPSLLIVHKEKKYLIDVGPDYRTQALNYHIDALDGVLITHTHYDHIGGIDELRVYTSFRSHPLPCLLSKESLEELKIRYHYFIHPNKKPEERKEKFNFHILEKEQGTIQFAGLELSYISYDQLGMKVNGFIFGPFAYVVDILEYKEEVFQMLKKIDILIMSGRGWQRSRGHLSLKEAIDFSKKSGAKRTYFTHIAHEMEHAEASHHLPEGFSLAYDGLQLMV